jgi:iron complex outermembrane recepter protein
LLFIGILLLYIDQNCALAGNMQCKELNDLTFAVNFLINMKNLFFTCMFTGFSTVAVTAQTISGVVRQADQKPVEFATVTLRAATDSTVVKGAMTGADGAFDIMGAPTGRYFMEANVIGMGKGTTPAFDYDGKDLQWIEAIVLQEAAQQLAGVTISARRPTIEVKADKTILNVEGTVSSTGLNALELLRKAPGVTVDNNENVQVKGKNKVRILVDGRETPLSGKDLSATLKSMQASDIAAIEIISNPSAKYDAAGNAGIINIRLKKNKALGTNGNINLGGTYGFTPKGEGSLSLNHRGKKFNAFGTVNGNVGEWRNDNTFVRTQNGQTFDQHAIQKNMNENGSARVGFDWYANDKHTFGILLKGRADGGDWTSTSRALIGTEGETGVNSILDATNDIENQNNNLNTNFNYRFADTSGHSLNFDFDYGTYRIRSVSDQPNFYKSADGNTITQRKIYQLVTPTDIDIITVKADYEQRLWKGTLGLGFKIADVKTDNTFDFFNVVEELPVRDTDKSNRFKYAERTNAAYVNYNRSFGKKLNVQTGLRLENTDYMGDLIADTPQNGEKVENEYTELFPSAAITYSLNKKMGLNLTYSRRIDRPSYQDLNPFEFKLDELTYQKGNPRLRPQFTNSFELSPTFGGFPVLTLGYSRTKDVFTQILDTTNITATFITQANIADQTNYTVTLNFPTPIAKWWEGFVSVTGFHSNFQANIRENYQFEQSFNAMNVYAEQTIKLPKGFSVQLSGWYNTPAFWGTFKTNHQGMMDLGIQKKILDDKGELRLRVGDILRTGGFSGENLFTPGLKMNVRGTWESRIVSLNFSYRFGSTEVKSARQRKTGLEDESRRVKTSRN